MCKFVVLDLYQKVSRLIRKEMNRKRATDRNLSPIYSLRLPFILYPNITSVNNVTSQYYQGLKGCESGGDRTHLRPFTFSSLVFFWHNFVVKHAISAISHMICSYIHCSELTGSVLSS